jgi:signal transduction histidine kinase
VEIQVSVLNKNLNIKVQDNGCGISGENMKSLASQHFGLSIMRDRAESIGGNFSIVSSPGEGACIMVSVPLQQAKKSKEREWVYQ